MYNSTEKIILNRGGARSSKTASIIQILLLKLITETNKRTVVARKTLSILKDTFIHEMQEWIDHMNIGHLLKYYKHTATLWCYVTKSSIKFLGCDEPRKFRGLEANYWVFNEANEIPYEFFQQAIMRMSRKTDDKPNQFFLDFNPSSRYSWVKTKVEDVRDDVKIITSTYKDNPFLSKDAIKEIELLKQTDPDSWIIYGTGDYTDIIGAIYKKFNLVDKFPVDAKNIIYGLDFGFTNDPSSLIKVGEKSGELYYEEIFYEKGLTNQDISIELNNAGLNPKIDTIICDSAEPKSIEELKRLGWKVKGAKKGQDSIKHGISTVKQYPMNIIKSGNNLLMELNLYKWYTDRDGRETNKPIDKNNHLMDALRYAVSYNWSTKPRGNIKVF